MIYTSFLLFSNHENAIAAAASDRRLYTINNVGLPAEPAYFAKLHEWLNSDDWEKHVWRWLMEREPDLARLHRPPEMTKGKQTMLDSTRSPMAVAVDAILDRWPAAMVCQGQIEWILGNHMTYLGFDYGQELKFRKTLTAVMRDRTIGLDQPPKIRVRLPNNNVGKQMRPKVLADIDHEIVHALCKKYADDRLIDQYVEEMREVDLAPFVDIVKDELDSTDL
jgi:hypothetical protein